MAKRSSGSSDAVTITVLRTSDAAKAEIDFSLSQSLNELKRAIAKNKTFSPQIDPKYQRLFHLGRELKSGGRSLENLGIGKFHNFTLHLHSSQPETCDLLSSDDEVEIIVQQARPQQQQQANNENNKHQTVIDLLDDSDEEQEGKRRRVS